MYRQHAALAFQTHGKPIQWVEFGQGHINLTLKVETDAGHPYILQRINHHVFRDPVGLMENLCAITAFLQEKNVCALHFIPTVDGGYFYQDPDGNYWRMYDFVPGVTLDNVECPEDFYRCGLGFGSFQMLLADFPAHTLHETIPCFHNTPHRYCQLKESIAADPVGRLAEVQPEVDFLLAHEQQAGTLQRMLDAGQLPLRVTHNDTKLSNILFDRENRPLCILDLDTVMPGLSAMDFADAIRSGAATATEDEPDTSKMALDLALFRSFATGFLEAATTLTPAEINILPLGALVITLEQAARFLKDYLDGDTYYRIAYPTHNLVRARAQIALAADMLLKMADMDCIITEIRRKTRNTSSC